MKSNKFIVICFFSILFGILILYPVNYLLARFNVISIISFSNKGPNYKSSGLLSGVYNKIEAKKTTVINKTSNIFSGYNI